jgi:nucleoside-diphosphate-sugar epimerase
MHVLIIGGTRFVGALLTWRLLARGDTVTLFNRGRLTDPFGDRIERLRGDRTTPDLARSLVGRRFDAVVDFAAYTGEDARTAIAALGDRAGHYVFISTGQVYLVREGCPRPARELDYA